MNKFIKLFLLSLIFLGNSWAIGDLPSANFIIDPSLTTLNHATTLNASSSRDTWGGKNLSYSFKLNNDGSWSNFSSSAIDNINISSKGFNTDIHASAEYRAHLISVLAKKAVAGCK